MALNGFKDFQTSAILSEGDIDNYLMQGVLVFANSTARDSALGTTDGAGGLHPGRAVFLTSSATLQCWTGSAWVDIASQTYVNTAISNIRDPLIRLYMEAGLSMM